MHVITPFGSTHIFSTARHAAQEDGCIRLYSGPDKTEWIADIPLGWAVVAGAPKKSPTATPPYVSGYEEVREDQRKRTTTWLFGIIPLFVQRTGRDHG